MQRVSSGRAHQWNRAGLGYPQQAEELPVAFLIGLDMAFEELGRATRKRATAELPVQRLAAPPPAGTSLGRTMGLLALAAVAAYFVLGELGVVNAMSIFGG